MLKKITPVILSGGSGTRLWPASRKAYPKQLLPLVSDYTLIQESALRVNDSTLFTPPLYIANEEHRFIIAEQLRELDIDYQKIVLEPDGRNTAPAIALAALVLKENDPDALMLVMPSDHVITDEAAFMSAIQTGKNAAAAGALVTFGILPTSPETGYGYLEQGEELEGVPGCFALKSFIEKPDEDTAQSYLDQGIFHWNAGIFLFSTNQFLEELSTHAPNILTACTLAMETATHDMNFIRPNTDAFKKSPSISIDYAIMEKTTSATVVPVSMGWNDVGTWSSLWDIAERDNSGNSITGPVFMENTTNCLIRSDKATVATIGLDNLIVVATKDAILVSDKNQAQNVKQIVDRLAADDNSQTNFHTVVHRPWGTYERIDAGEGFQVKRILVYPKGSLSLQSHNHRSEHWVVVQGAGKVTIDDEVRVINEGQSVYIPVGAKHRIENPGKQPVVFIEVQTGTYLGEDDIVRYEDFYGRI